MRRVVKCRRANLRVIVSLRWMGLPSWAMLCVCHRNSTRVLNFFELLVILILLPLGQCWKMNHESLRFLAEVFTFIYSAATLKKEHPKFSKLARYAFPPTFQLRFPKKKTKPVRCFPFQERFLHLLTAVVGKKEIRVLVLNYVNSTLCPNVLLWLSDV